MEANAAYRIVIESIGLKKSLEDWQHLEKITKKVADNTKKSREGVKAVKASVGDTKKLASNMAATTKSINEASKAMNEFTKSLKKLHRESASPSGGSPRSAVAQIKREIADIAKYEALLVAKYEMPFHGIAAPKRARRVPSHRPIKETPRAVSAMVGSLAGAARPGRIGRIGGSGGRGGGSSGGRGGGGAYGGSPAGGGGMTVRDVNAYVNSQMAAIRNYRSYGQHDAAFHYFVNLASHPMIQPYLYQSMTPGSGPMDNKAQSAMNKLYASLSPPSNRPVASPHNYNWFTPSQAHQKLPFYMNGRIGVGRFGVRGLTPRLSVPTGGSYGPHNVASGGGGGGGGGAAGAGGGLGGFGSTIAGALADPLVLPLILATAGVAAVAVLGVAITKKVMSQAKVIRSISQIAVGTGGSTRDARNLMAMSMVSGVSPQGIAAMGANMSRNPAIMAFTNVMPNFAGPFGDINNAKRSKALIKDFLKASPDRARRLASIEPGLANFAPYRLLSKKEQDEAINMKANPVSKRTQRMAARMQVELAKFHKIMMDIWNQAARAFGPYIVRGLKLLNNFMKGIRTIVTWMANFMSWIQKFIASQPILRELIRFTMGPIGWLTPGKSSLGEANSAQEKNTKAVTDNTKAVKNLQTSLDIHSKIWGGGKLIGEGIPTGWIYGNLDAQAQKRMINLGSLGY